MGEPSSLTLWSTGVKPIPLVEDLIESIPEQTKRSGVLVDSTMLAYGTTNIYALGDCATLYDGRAMLDELEGIFEKADRDTSGCLDKPELLAMFPVLEGRYPQAEVF